MKSKILFISLLVWLASCHKDTDTSTEGEILDPPVIVVTTKLVSQTDTTALEALHAVQTFDGADHPFTDFPFLVARGSQINRDFELITLTTPDQHQYFQVQSLVENDVNYMHWVLPDLHVTIANTVEHVQIPVEEGVILDIPVSSILNSNGTPYAGNYKIEYAVLDPSSHLADAIPSFQALDDDHQHLALNMKACYFVTVSTEGGEKLQFATQASIEFNNGIIGQHWYFDEHRSAWNSIRTSGAGNHIDLNFGEYFAVAQADTPVRLQGQLRINGRLTPHQRIQISYGNVVRHVYSTNKGNWTITLPVAISCTIELPLPCNDQYTLNFITPEQDEDGFLLDVVHEQSLNSAFTGEVRNYQGKGVDEAYLLIDGAGSTFLYSDQDTFQFNIPICANNSITVQGLNIATGETGPVIRWQAEDSVNLYSVFACEASKKEYLSLTVSGDTKMYWDLTSSINDASRLVVEEGDLETDLDIEIAVSGMTNREYEDIELNMRFEDQQLGQRGYSLYCPTSTSGCGFSKFIITHFPDQQGEWIRGYFEGNFWIKTFHPLTAAYRPVRGEFQVYRDF